MKNKGIITLITLLSVLIIALIILMCVVIKNKPSFKFNFMPKQVLQELQIEKTYEEILNKISINTKAADIEIKKSEDETIKLKIYSKKDQAEAKVENNTLKITVDNEKCNFLCINTKISKVELYIPENYESKMDINNNYGDVKIEKFENLTLNINEDAGDIIIDTVNNANINNKYGDIKINTIKIGNIKASAGNIEINTTNNIKIENNYGDVKINNINEYTNIKANCGDIKIDNLNIIEDSNIENDYGDIKINKTNAYVDAQTDLGNLKINNNKSDITLKINNNCGDIKVN